MCLVQNKHSIQPDGVTNPFIQKHQSDVIGVLRGFDRLRFAGTFRALYHPPVMEKYIQKAGFLMKDFKQLMLQVTGQIKAATQRLAAQAGRPLLYLSSSQVRKEQVARQIAERDGVNSGLIAVLSCVEPCRTYTVGGNRQTKMLEARLAQQARQPKKQVNELDFQGPQRLRHRSWRGGLPSRLDWY